MRILIATGIFKPEVGGPATLALELAKRLSGSGHNITLVTYSDKKHFNFDNEFSFNLIRVVRKKNKILNYVAYFRAVLREIKKADIVYTLDWFSAGIPIFFASKFTGKKYMVRVGGGYIWEKYLAEGHPPLTLRVFYERGLHKKYWVMFFIIRRILKNAQYVIFNSDIQRELYQEIYNLTEGQTLTIYNAIPENRLSGLIQNYNDNNIARDKEIIYAGRFLPVKNVDSLVKAFAQMSDKSYKLVLIGEGQLEPSIRLLVNDLGIQKRVEFLPPMSQSDLYSRIARCHVVVIPSWTDVSPNQVYECSRYY
jgi:glycosyltransferase involved in cell wall biosynthesis